MRKFYLALYGFFLAVFVWMSYLAHQSFIFPSDIALSSWLKGLDRPFFHAIMQFLSSLNSSIPAVVIVSVATIGLLLSRRRLEAIFVVSLTSLAALLNWLLKWLIDRPRPGSEAGGLSFPSGHTIFAIVFYGLLFYLAPRLTKPRAVTIILQTGLLLIILLSAVSRIHLGAHWPSDTIGSFLLGGLLLVPTFVLYQRYARDRKIGAKKNA